MRVRVLGDGGDWGTLKKKKRKKELFYIEIIPPQVVASLWRLPFTSVAIVFRVFEGAVENSTASAKRFSQKLTANSWEHVRIITSLVQIRVRASQCVCVCVCVCVRARARVRACVRACV